MLQSHKCKLRITYDRNSLRLIYNRVREQTPELHLQLCMLSH